MIQHFLALAFYTLSNVLKEEKNPKLLFGTIWRTRILEWRHLIASDLPILERNCTKQINLVTSTFLQNCLQKHAESLLSRYISITWSKTWFSPFDFWSFPHYQETVILESLGGEEILGCFSFWKYEKFLLLLKMFFFLSSATWKFSGGCSIACSAYWMAVLLEASGWSLKLFLCSTWIEDESNWRCLQEEAV